MGMWYYPKRGFVDAKIITFLMFDGKAEDAINFYISLFDSSKI
jgi:predicted 3-demethylubiquinone-9 3-methyltransferase (glyoxalase superfamily)